MLGLSLFSCTCWVQLVLSFSPYPLVFFLLIIWISPEAIFKFNTKQSKEFPTNSIIFSTGKHTLQEVDLQLAAIEFRVIDLLTNGLFLISVIYWIDSLHSVGFWKFIPTFLLGCELWEVRDHGLPCFSPKSWLRASCNWWSMNSHWR